LQVFQWFSNGFPMVSTFFQRDLNQDLFAALRRLHPAILHGLRSSRRPRGDVITAGFWMVLAGQSWFLVEIFFFWIILVGASVLVGLL
jgi:fatty acid desaturase